MVYEFAELQGYVGKQYALKWGIDTEIADGIYFITVLNAQNELMYKGKWIKQFRN